jgi:hypothetical protein
MNNGTDKLNDILLSIILFIAIFSLKNTGINIDYLAVIWIVFVIEILHYDGKNNVLYKF